MTRCTLSASDDNGRGERHPALSGAAGREQPQQVLIAQPTLSQQIRRLEEMVGTPLLQRRREGVRLTEAGSVLEESRAMLSASITG
jgi:hypothetical protein